MLRNTLLNPLASKHNLSDDWDQLPFPIETPQSDQAWGVHHGQGADPNSNSSEQWGVSLEKHVDSQMNWVQGYE